MKGMILAAGLGTRLKPFTDLHPKALAPVNGKSLLRRNIEYLYNSGVSEVIVNVHHFANQIIEETARLTSTGPGITISDERDEVLETGGGLLKARHFFESGNEPFVLMNVDILTDLDLPQMITAHRESGSLATLAVTDRQTSRYLLFDESKKLCGWRNENSGEQKGLPGTKQAFSGIHIISPGIFPLITESGKFSMVDLYLRLAPVVSIRAFDHSGTKFIDVGRPESILLAEKMWE